MATIKNAVIHITEADPSKHNGERGYLWAVRIGSNYCADPERRVCATRIVAAIAAAGFVDDVEKGVAKGFDL